MQNGERFADRGHFKFGVHKMNRPGGHFGKFDGEGRNISQRHVIGISAHLMVEEISKH